MAAHSNHGSFLFHRKCAATYWTLSGTATDQTDARVPGAKVVVKSDTTGDTRETKADASGFFSVTALIPGTYTLAISAKASQTGK